MNTVPMYAASVSEACGLIRLDETERRVQALGKPGLPSDGSTRACVFERGPYAIFAAPNGLTATHRSQDAAVGFSASGCVGPDKLCRLRTERL